VSGRTGAPRLARSQARRLAATVLVCVTAPFARAQSVEQPSGVVITAGDLRLAAGATAGAALLTRVDVPVARFFGDSAFHARHPGLATAATRASFVTETLLMLTGGTIYGIARLHHDDATGDVALHTTESVASAALFIQVVRGALGRARPYVIDAAGEKRDTDPYDFEPLHGFTSFNYRSFPSMHAMASVAVATALSQEMRRRGTPHRALLSPLLYVGAAVPPLARLYLDEHWASDIAMGAFLGAFAGQKVVTYSHDHPDNRIDRALLGRRMSVGFTSGPHGLSLFASPF
jgi:membrane-associated phospholipid phosphatase